MDTTAPASQQAPEEALPAALAVLPEVPTAEQIERLEAAMLAMEHAPGAPPPPHIDLAHHFGGGLYARRIDIPAGTVLTGLRHLHAHLNVCAGDITVWTEGGMRRLTGVHVLPSEPGAKRVGFAHAPTAWISIHLNPTGTQDLDELARLNVEAPHLLLENRKAIGSVQ